MSITYPLTPPATPLPSSMKLTGQDAVAVVQSPFTFQTQVQAWPGQVLMFDVTLPPMPLALAEPWVAFLLAMHGQFGTCLFGDRSYTGAAGNLAGSTPQVNGTNNAQSQTLAVKGLALSTLWLKAGDYISVGSGTTTRLYKNLTDSTSNGSGLATIDIFPCLREALTNGTTISTTSPLGCFRLAQNVRSWSIDTAKIYGISFSLIEAL